MKKLLVPLLAIVLISFCCNSKSSGTETVIKKNSLQQNAPSTKGETDSTVVNLADSANNMIDKAEDKIQRASDKTKEASKK